MYTKEEYQEALKQIAEYEQKQYEKYIMAKEVVGYYESNNCEGITKAFTYKKGDKVIYIGGSTSAYLTVGKEYEITWEPRRLFLHKGRHDVYIHIKLDNGLGAWKRADWFRKQ
jgi:hypothetical protein